MIITAIVLIVLLLIYYYGTRNFNYWAIRGVKHEKPIWLFGNYIQVYTLRKSMTQMSVEYYNKYPNERVVGFFRGLRPELLVRDPDIVKIVIATDFNSFQYRGFNQQKTVIEPLMRNLIYADGDLWRLLRQRMTPAFTSGKLKAMFPLIVERAERLHTHVLASGINERTLDARDLMARYNTDFIGAVGFGLDADSLNDEESEFRKLGIKMFEVTFLVGVKKILKEFFPNLFKHFHVFGKVERDMNLLVAGILKKRNYEPSGRNDFIDLMLECKKKGLISAESLTNFKADGTPEIATLELTEELIVAQVFIFFGAGFETSSSATSFTLHQLAYHPDVQEKVQKDIDRVLAKHGKLCYDAVQEMRYLEWTIKEGMRMFPSPGFLYRECARKYTFEELNLSVDEGVRIMIPLQALHNDPKYFEEPHKFRPERFDPAECDGMNKFVYLPFGDGPRSCIDMKIRVKWYKESSLLGDSADMHTLLPPRVRMHHNYSLQVDALESSDTAQYTCEILRPEPWGPIRQTHAIEVQYPPTVTTVPEDGFLEVKKGEYVDIGCETTGTPHPIVNWRKNGEGMALLEHRSRIRFRAEHRSLGGVYECVVKNGVGDPVTAHITVVIHDAPEVSVERSFVHTAIGLRAALAAKVEFAVPAARTSWYKDGRPVKTDDRIVWIVHDNIHELIFRSVRKSDLGNYTFRAENKLGMADVSFKLTGVPNVASFKVDQSLNKATSTSFTLIWEVDSYSTIIEYNLWLRPYYGRLATSEPDAFTTEAPANMWSKIVVPGDSSDGPIHSAIYTVRGLTPTTVYEAIVTSRNRFGWSKPSSILHFATEPGAGRTRPSTSDYTDITPILEEYDSEPHNITQAHIFGKNEAWSRGERGTPCMVTILILAICIRV